MFEKYMVVAAHEGENTESVRFFTDEDEALAHAQHKATVYEHVVILGQWQEGLAWLALRTFGGMDPITGELKVGS